MAGKILEMTLLENSHTFLHEAVANAVRAKESPIQWKFALLHLVQALELSLKETLRRAHPVLVFENVDRPGRTVSIGRALERIKNDQILGIKIGERDWKAVKQAIRTRNGITHSEFKLTEENATAKFAEVFAFLTYFQARHLGIEITHVLDPDEYKAVRDIRQCYDELKQKANQRMEDELQEGCEVWFCPECGDLTMAEVDEKVVCFLCRAEEELAECPHCGHMVIESELETFDDLLDWDEGSGGMSNLVGNYGYDEPWTACRDCLSAIKDDIFNQRHQDELYDIWREEEWERRHGRSRT